MLRFAIDAKSDSIYRSKETKETIFAEDESNEVVHIPMLAPVDECSVVTAEHYLHFDPEAVWPGFTYVPNHPKTLGKRTAFRDAVKKSEGKLLGDLPDPRALFGLSNGGMKFWEEFMLLSQGMKDDNTHSLPIAVYESSGREGVWYRLQERFAKRSGEPIDLYMTVDVGAATRFNVVSNTLSTDAARDHPTVKKLWQWAQYNGVFLPERAIDLRYAPENGRLVYQREMKLQECNVNGALVPSQFGYQGLGMSDGDVVMDNIDKVCYVIKNGSLEKLANYDEKYIPPGPGVNTYLPRWQVTVCSSLLVILVTIFVTRKYRKRRQ